MLHTCSAFHGVCESEGIMHLSVKENKIFCLKHILSLYSNSILCDFVAKTDLVVHSINYTAFCLLVGKNFDFLLLTGV